MIWKKVWAIGLTLSMMFANATPAYAMETAGEQAKTEYLARTDFALTDPETGEEGEDFSETVVEEEPGSEEEELPAGTDPAETPGEGEEQTVAEPGAGEEPAPEGQPAQEEPAQETQPAQEEPTQETQPAQEPANKKSTGSWKID